MDNVSGIVIAVVAIALVFRWGMRSGRLRREHGPPPGGWVKFIFEFVNVGYVVAGGALVAWLIGDSLEPGGVRAVLAMAASVGAFWLGRILEPRLTPRLPRLRRPSA